MSFRTYTTAAVVLHRINLGEHDKILTLYTLEKGKLNAVAKGARKPISKLAGATELFTHSRVQLAVGRTLDVVTQAEIAESFRRIRADLGSIAYASVMAELVDRFVEERDPHAEVFWLLIEALRALEQGGHGDLVTHCFELHFLSDLGYRPHLEDCVLCHEALESEPVAYSPAVGGTLCPTHRRGHADAIPVGLETLALARTLLRIGPSQQGPMETLAEHAGTQVRHELEKLLRVHVQYRLDRPLKSPDFVREVTAMDYVRESK